MAFDFGSMTLTKEDKEGKSEIKQDFDFKSISFNEPAKQFIEPLKLNDHWENIRTIMETAASGPAAGGVRATKELEKPSDAEALGRAQDAYSISQVTGLPIHEVSKHFDDFARMSKITGLTSDPTNKEVLTQIMTLPLAYGAAMDPVGTAAGYLVFSALDRLIPTSKFVPEDANSTFKSTVELLDFIGKGALAGEVFQKAPEALKQFSVFKMKQQAIPDMVKMSPEHFQNLENNLSPEEYTAFLKHIDIDPATANLSKVNGLPVNILADKLVPVTQEKYWDKVQQSFGIKPTAFKTEGNKTEIVGDKTLSEVPDKSIEKPKDLPGIKQSADMFERLETAPNVEEEPVKKPAKKPAKKKTKTYNVEKAVAEGDIQTLIKAHGKFSYPSHLAGEIGSGKQRLANMGKLWPMMKRGGVPLDSMLSEMKGEYPSLFNQFETDADLLRYLLEKQKGVKPTTEETLIQEALAHEERQSEIELEAAQHPEIEASDLEGIRERVQEEIKNELTAEEADDISFDPEQLEAELRLEAEQRPSELSSPVQSEIPVEKSSRKAKFGEPRDLPDQKESATALQEYEASRRQGGLFNERGSARIPPEVGDFAEGAQAIGEQVQRTFAPLTMDMAARMTAQDLRTALGKMARDYDIDEAATVKAHSVFEKAKDETNIEVIDRAERGLPQDDENVQKIMDYMQNKLRSRAETVQNLGTGKLQALKENYFSRYWKARKGGQEIKSVQMVGAKRPFEGGKGFTKERSFEYFKDGINAGYEPASHNPVDFFLWKIREMDRYIMSHTVLNGMKEKGTATYVPIGGARPEGWKEIADPIGTVYKSPMIPITEAVDTAVMGGLEKLADSLGIQRERTTKIGGTRLGYAERGTPIRQNLPLGMEDPKVGLYGPGKVVTKFATPEEVLAHEIGHQIDFMYGVREKMFGGKRPMSDFIYDRMIQKAQREGRLTDIEKFEKQKVINKELRNLAEATEGPKHWRRKSTEKMAVMVESIIHAPEEFQRIAPTAYKMITDIIKGDEKLRPLLDIKPDIRRNEVRSSEVYAGGLVIAGKYYTPEGSALVLNNYLSPGLRGNPLYDLWRQSGNAMTQFQLGFSAFHIGFVTLDSVISKVALAGNYISRGKAGSAAATFLEAPFTPVTTFLKGDRIQRAWYGDTSNAQATIMADVMSQAGGRARMDAFYAIEGTKQIKRSFKEGKLIKGILQIPYAISEIAMKPVMQEYVPRMKMGIFNDIMKMEIETNPNVSHQDFVRKAQAAWDSVDNRMGQLVYDNLFWNKTLKDLAMVSVRSVGWNLGTIREVGGGILDYARFVTDALSRKKPDFTYRMAYVTALPIVVGLYGAIYQYLATGSGPQEIKDYFYPKVPGVDQYGNQNRISLPSYMKDLYHYYTNPVQTVLNKINPVDAAIVDMVQNKDFYGQKIYNEDDPFMQKVLDDLKFLVKQYEPFTFQNFEKTKNQPAAQRAQAFFGITPAPYDINMTDAEKVAFEFQKGKIPQGGQTAEQKQHQQAKSDARSEYVAKGKDEAVLEAAVEKGTITEKEKNTIINNASKSRLEVMTKTLTLEEALRVYRKATPEEKKILDPIIKKKRANMMAKGGEARVDRIYQELFGKDTNEDDDTD